ncbi:hypothetical protein EVAR_75822_1 [Eumeta japonica]|uniref:Uncharacterized protein n=1 Tax=Eumeta variegata TaxID=151549 RepID=A0A4C1TCZ9_EUMVA|nr:hypothetical protein EVAR_75822_1 [Eumeta japonica]
MKDHRCDLSPIKAHQILHDGTRDGRRSARPARAAAAVDDGAQCPCTCGAPALVNLMPFIYTNFLWDPPQRRRRLDVSPAGARGGGLGGALPARAALARSSRAARAGLKMEPTVRARSQRASTIHSKFVFTRNRTNDVRLSDRFPERAPRCTDGRRRSEGRGGRSLHRDGPRRSRRSLRKDIPRTAPRDDLLEIKYEKLGARKATNATCARAPPPARRLGGEDIISTPSTTVTSRGVAGYT